MSEPTEHADDRDPTIADSFHADVPELGGTFVGKYQIKRQIASGGMGVVYEAVQEQPRRSVALKLMRMGLGSRAALHRFQTESQTMARLHHPNIAQVYEAGTHSAGGLSVPYFAMEYIAGARAIDTYASAKQLGTIARLELFAQLCDAVEHGHSRGIIHRDLKPPNVLVGADGVLKVIDFGVARAIDSDLASPTLQTMAGAVIGTPIYCSPEQFEGDSSALDERTDVYSLGVLLYELLVGRLPYEFTTQALPEVSRVICSQEPVRPSKVNGMLGRDVDAVILTALRKDRTQRYVTAAALAADVRCLIDGNPVSTYASSRKRVTVAKACRIIARHPAGTALIIMIISWLLAWRVALPLLYMTPIDRWIQSRIVSRVPFRDPGRSLQSVKVITIEDTTDLRGIGERERLAGLSEQNLQSQRRLLGRLLERLAGTDVRMVVFDMYFRASNDEIDRDFIAGIRKFKASGGEVIIGTKDWWIGADDSKLVAPAIKQEVAIGCIGAGIQGDAPWALELFVEHKNADAIPSLSLVSYARFRHPGTAISLRPQEYNEAVEIRYRAPTTQSVVPVVAADSDVVEVSTLRDERSDSATAGLVTGDRIGRFVVPLPSHVALEQSTLEIGVVLFATPQERARLIDRPVVLVASNRTGVDGPFNYVDGRQYRGFYAQAVGLDMLLRGDAIRVPRRFHEWTLMWIGVVLGVGVARMRKFNRQWLTLCTLAAGGVLAVVIAYRMSWLVDPLICGVPLIIAYSLMLATAQLARTTR